MAHLSLSRITQAKIQGLFFSSPVISETSFKRACGRRELASPEAGMLSVIELSVSFSHTQICIYIYTYTCRCVGMYVCMYACNMYVCM